MIGLCDFFETIEIEQLDEHVTKDVDGDTYHHTDCGNHLVKVCSWGNMCSSGSLGHHQPPILTTQCMPPGPHASCLMYGRGYQPLHPDCSNGMVRMELGGGGMHGVALHASHASIYLMLHPCHIIPLSVD